MRTRVLRGSELSAPFLGARGGRYFVYLSHAGEEDFRRFWGFPPPINDSSLADSCRLCSTTRGFIISVSLSTVHQFDCETSAQFALLRVDFVSFPLPLSLPVICFGVYCTAGFHSGQCNSQVVIWACLAYVVGGRRGAVSLPSGDYIVAYAPPSNPAF